MSIKTIALAAATVAATATAATANNYFGFNGVVDAESGLDIGLVRSEAAGVVEIYDYRLGEQGQLLGTETVNAGANSDVRVNVGIAPIGDVIALLKIDGEVVAEQRFDIEE